MLLLAALLLTPPPATPPPAIANLMYIEEVLNDKCRDDPDAQRACDIRDGVLAKIEELGWCWGHPGEIQADKTWEPCPAKNTR